MLKELWHDRRLSICDETTTRAAVIAQRNTLGDVNSAFDGLGLGFVPILGDALALTFGKDQADVSISAFVGGEIGHAVGAGNEGKSALDDDLAQQRNRFGDV